MKLKYVFLALLTLFLTTNSLAAIDFGQGIQVNDSYVEVGETVKFSANIDSDKKIQTAYGKWNSWMGWESSGSCFNTYNGCEATFTFTPSYSGEKTLRMKATSDGMDDYEYAEPKTITVHSQDQEERWVKFKDLPDNFKKGNSYQITAEAKDEAAQLYGKEFKIQQRVYADGQVPDRYITWNNVATNTCYSWGSTHSCTVSGDFNPQYTGEYKLRAKLTTDDGVTLKDTAIVTVEEGETTPPVSLKGVSASDYRVSYSDGSTTLKADVKNNRQELLYVSVKWKANGQKLAEDFFYINADSTETVEKEISYETLKRKLNTDTGYNLKATLSYASVSETKKASKQLVVESRDGPSVQISNIRTTDSDVREGDSPTFKADIRPDQDIGYLAVSFKIGNAKWTKDFYTLNGGKTKTVKKTLDWQELSNKLTTGRNYDVKVKVHNDKISNSKTSSSLFFLADATEEPPAVELNSITLSDYTLSEGESTTFKAKVKNNKGRLAYVQVKWRADGTSIVSEDQYISAGSTETVKKRISYQVLKDKGLNVDKNYNIGGNLIYEIGNIDVSKDAPQNLYLKEGTDEKKVEIRDLWSTDKNIKKGEKTRFKTKIHANDYTSYLEARFYVDGTRLDTEQLYNLNNGETKTVSSPESWTWRELKKNFATGQYHDLKVRLKNYEVDRSKTVSKEFYLAKTQDLGECSVRVESLKLGEKVITRGESTQASVRVHNNGDSQEFKVKFQVSGNTVDTISREISGGSSSKFSTSVSPTSDKIITAKVITEGDPCGHRTYSRYQELSVVGDDDDDDGKDQPRDPEASFYWTPSQPSPDKKVTFDASGSTDPDGDITQYKWFFGDSSSPAYGKTVKHSYSSTGSYDVQLVVKDSKGNTDSLTRTVPVRQKPGACSVQVSSLNLAESVITRGESTGASITVSNLGEKQVFNVKFMSSGNVVKNKEVAIGANSQRTFSKAFSPNVDTIVTAKVSTQSGEGPCPFKEWTRFKELVVVGTEEEPSSLEVNVRSSEGKRLYNARVAVDKPSGGTNVRYTGASGRAVFDLSKGTFDVTVSKSGYGSESRTVTLAEGQNKEITVTLDESEDSQGSLIALVEDGEGNRLENAEVTVLDGAQKTESTDSNGRAVINLDSGTYTVKAEKSGYGTRIKTVEIDQGEDTTEVFHLTDEEGLVITDVQYPSSVCRGATMKAQVTIENRGGLHQFISLTGSGLGSINAVSSFSLESGSQVTKTLYFTNVQGTGSEEFTVTVSNHDSDKAERTVQVNSCPVPTTDKPSDISLTVSYTRKPQMAVAGDIIKVDGFVDGVSGRSTVDILIDGEVKATVNTNPGGYYQTWITAEEVGPHTIKAKAGEATATKPLRIIPTSQVTAIEAPASIFEGQNYQICAQVNSQITPEVVLVRDGKVVKSKNAKGRVCFQRKARQPGMHKYKIAALTSGTGNTASTTVEVLEMDVETSTFPKQIASVESGSGLVKVELYNNNDNQTDYDLTLEGLPSTWISQSEKSVILDKGERRTVYFYLTPQEEGSYRPTIKVEADGSQIYSEKLDVITGGTTDSTKEKDGIFHNVVEGLANFFSF